MNSGRGLVMLDESPQWTRMCNYDSAYSFYFICNLGSSLEIYNLSDRRCFAPEC